MGSRKLKHTLSGCNEFWNTLKQNHYTPKDTGLGLGRVLWKWGLNSLSSYHFTAGGVYIGRDPFHSDEKDTEIGRKSSFKVYKSPTFTAGIHPQACGDRKLHHAFFSVPYSPWFSSAWSPVNRDRLRKEDQKLLQKGSVLQMTLLRWASFPFFLFPFLINLFFWSHFAQKSFNFLGMKDTLYDIDFFLPL